MERAITSRKGFIERAITSRCMLNRGSSSHLLIAFRGTPFHCRHTSRVLLSLPGLVRFQLLLCPRFRACSSELRYRCCWVRPRGGLSYHRLRFRCRRSPSPSLAPLPPTPHCRHLLAPCIGRLGRPAATAGRRTGVPTLRRKSCTMWSNSPMRARATKVR